MFELLQGLLKVYPEFKPLAETAEQIEQWQIYFNKAKCLIPKFAKVTDENLSENCRLALPLFMVTAHYFVMDGLAESIGLNSTGGSISSSSVGDVSVSFNSPPYANTSSPNFDYFWSATKYGQEYLAWLDTQSGIRWVM